MDRKLLKRTFTLDSTPDWICPACGKGILRIKKETFFKEERTHSRREHSQDDWEPEWTKYVYSCLLCCTNDKCTEVVSTSGIGFVESYTYDNENNGISGYGYEDCFIPKFFEPALRIINIPPSCPGKVSIHIEESFRLFFASPSAAANNIRVAIEQLLSELKIKRFNINRGKRRYIPLHDRIPLIPAKYSELKEMILAIKWLGNAGSHSHGNVTLDDVMDAYELTEHILQEIYAPKAKKLKVMANKINKKKGPVT